jgi:osmotically-inducible protein OsmY
MATGILLLAACFCLIRPGTARASAVYPGAIQGHADRQIADDVRQRIKDDVRVSVMIRDLEVSALRGVVTLQGTVDTLLTRQILVALARTTRRVRSVIDRLTLEATRRPDEKIRQDVASLIDITPALSEERIKVRVRRGVVRLEGQVRSWADRDRARRRATGVRGVTAVDNQISVRPIRHRDHLRVEEEIYSRLRADERADTRLVVVNVHDGVARVSGSVAYPEEKSLVELLCWNVGIERVDTSELAVSGIDMDRNHRPGLVVKSARQIQRDLAEAYRQDPRLSGARPQVRALMGVVTLTGTVSSLDAWRAAEQDALNTPGVVEVHSFMTVAPPTRG